MKQLILVLSLSLFLFSCGQKDSKQKETEQKDTVQNKIDSNNVVPKVDEPKQIDSISNPVNDSKLITGKSAGPFLLQSSLDDVRKAVQPPMSLGKAEEGFEGDKYYTVTQGKEKIMRILVYTDHVTEIEIFDKSFHTADSIHTGMLLTDAEKKYGKLKSIDIDEQEDFEFAHFDKEPGVDFIISLNQKGKKAGVYANDENSTTKYDPKASITMLRIRGGE